MKFITSKLLLLSLIVTSASLAAPAFAQEQEEEIVTPAHTAEAYRSKARIYTAKAAVYRKEAERHKEVARRFREERDTKNRPANTQSDIKEMDKRCKALSEHAVVLAKDADLLSEFYERHARAIEADAGTGAGADAGTKAQK